LRHLHLPYRVVLLMLLMLLLLLLLLLLHLHLLLLLLLLLLAGHVIQYAGRPFHLPGLQICFGSFIAQSRWCSR
jgi:hypothetical protein